MKKTIVFIITFLLIIFPFFAYYSLIKINNPLVFNVQLHYFIMILLGLFLAFLIEHTTRNTLHKDTKHSLFLILGSCVWLYAAFLLLMTWSRYANFVSEVIDLHYFHQAVWQLSEFKNPYIWGFDQPSFAVWGQHFSPILIFLAPFYWIGKDPGFLMFIQALVVISGALPIYLIAKEHLKARSIGLALGYAYLAFGGLQFGFAYGFHEIMFFPTLFLWTYYFYLRKKVKSYYIFILLSLFVKEEVAFIVSAWSIYLLFVKRDKTFGIITAAIAIAWYTLCFHIIFPHLSPGGQFGFLGQYNTTGEGGILGIIKYIILNPLSFLQTLVTPTLKIDTFFQTFGSFSFLLFLYPPSFLIVIPSLLVKLLSSGIAMANGAHYSAAITAVTIVATFESFPHFYQNKLIKKFIHDKNIFFSVLIMYVALCSNIFYGYIGYSPLPDLRNSLHERGLTPENKQFLDQIIKSIPSKATVSAQYQITPHIKKSYKEISIWPGMNGTEDFVIIDTQLLPVLGASSEDYNKHIELLNNNKDYQLAVNQFGVLVYRKKSFKLN
jgi:uncharacterized membrane protein